MKVTLSPLHRKNSKNRRSVNYRYYIIMAALNDQKTYLMPGDIFFTETN